MKTAEEIITPFIKKVKSGFGDFEMVDKHNAIKCIELFYKQFVGDLIESEHPDEIYPRAENWLQERRNWIAEVKILREKLEQEVNQFKQLPIGEEGIDGCENCKHNIPGLEEGYYCINNCINGSQFEAMGMGNVKYPRQQTQPLSKEVEENKYPIGGYAPGNYECICCTCNLNFFGDKRAVQCEKCATSTPSIKEEKVSNDFEKEAEDLYPIGDDYLGIPNYRDAYIKEVLKHRSIHIKASQLHCTTGLDQLIEWMEWESHRRWNESHELPDFTGILTKANEIKSSLK